MSDLFQDNSKPESKANVIRVGKSKIKLSWLKILGTLCFILILILILHYKKIITLPQYGDNSSPLRSSATFFSQTATIDGQFTKVSNNTATVKAKNGKVDIFPVASNVQIFQAEIGSSPVASISAGTKNIKLNKPAQITLEAKNGSYEIKTIIYNP